VRVSRIIHEIVQKVYGGGLLDAEEIVHLLEVSPHSRDAGYVVGAADEINRLASCAKAEIHAQIGINLSPCPNNCLFCAFAAKNNVFHEPTELSADDVVSMGKHAEAAGANALFVMATGDYPFSRLIDISKELHRNLKAATVMIANVGDFDDRQARELKDCGYTGIYHAVRLGEGRDTKISPETRLKTVDAARNADLLIGTCVEPIGPEHDTMEIVEKILIGREMRPCYSGAMRRISIPGSELSRYGMMTEYQMAHLVAVVRLAMGRFLAGNCTHEPSVLGAISGANLFWAEAGTNPRDTEEDTSEGRGLDVAACRAIFREADYKLLEGASVIYSQTDSLR
jgi:biotin synthase